MRKLRSGRSRLPRWASILICVFLALALSSITYIFKGSPPLTQEMAFRRAEKEHLMGPGKIMAQVDTGSSAYPGITVADEGEGYVLFTHSESRGSSSSWNRFCYKARTGPVTLMAEPLDGFLSHQDDSICIFAFDQVPGAVRAELEITVEQEFNGAACSKTYTSKADRQYDGFFIFPIKCTWEEDRLEREKESYLISAMARTTDSSPSVPESSPATIRLYGQGGELLETQETALMNVLAAVQAGY